MLGDSPARTRRNADVVMQIETKLAKASWTAVERRDPYKLKHKMNLEELGKVVPNFDWALFFSKVEAPKFEVVDVSALSFQGTKSTVQERSLDNWKNYPALSRGELLRTILADILCRKFRFLQQVFERRKRDTSSLEALRAICGR